MISIDQGQTATFDIVGIPLNGFNSSIFLTIDGPTCIPDLSLNPTVINPPYLSALNVNNTASLLPGFYKIVVTGENGPIVESDTCILQINTDENINWTYFNDENSGLAYNTVTSLNVDMLNHLWVGVEYTDGYGEPPGCLAKFDGSKWEVWTDETHYITSYCGNLLFEEPFDLLTPNGSVQCLVSDLENHLWVGTTEKLLEYDGSQWETQLDISSRAITVDSENHIWVATEDGLKEFNGSTWTTYDSDNSGLPTNDLREIGIAPNGKIWIGTFYEGIVSYDGTFWSAYNTSNSNIPNDFVDVISIDPSGQIWTASQANGVAIFDGSDWIQLTTLNSGLAAEDVNDIFFDRVGTAWLGITDSDSNEDSGLNQFDGDVWNLYNSSNVTFPQNVFNSVPNDMVYSITQDLDSTIWFGVWGGGLGAFNPNGLDDFLPLSVSDNNYRSENVSIYPIPTKDFLNVQLRNSASVHMIELVDLNGRKLMQTTINDRLQVFSIDLQEVSSGPYILKLTGKTLNYQTLIVKER